MNTDGPAFLVKPRGLLKRPTPGIKLRLELDQVVDDRKGPHRVGKAEFLPDGRVAM